MTPKWNFEAQEETNHQMKFNKPCKVQETDRKVKDSGEGRAAPSGLIKPCEGQQTIRKVKNSGEGGIRTHGDDERHNGFRDRPDRPLWHLSELRG